jgi:hypothetical protein
MRADDRFLLLFSHPPQLSRCLITKAYPSDLNRLEPEKRTNR